LCIQDGTLEVHQLAKEFEMTVSFYSQIDLHFHYLIQTNALAATHVLQSWWVGWMIFSPSDRPLVVEIENSRMFITLTIENLTI
jgi:hypothetical protein